MVAAAVHRGVLAACVVALCGCEYPREPGSAYHGGGPDVADVVAADAVVEDVLGGGPDVADVVMADVVVEDVARDAAPTCAAPMQTCGGRCVNTATDSSNCGACGTVCSSGACSGG